MNMEEEILADTINKFTGAIERIAPNTIIPGTSKAQTEALFKIIESMIGEAAKYSHRQTILKIYNQVKNMEKTIQ